MNLKDIWVAWLLGAAISLLPISARAQQSDLPGAVGEMARALAKSKIRTVLVFDFIGPNKKLNVLGEDLADKFSVTLQNAAPGLAVINRTAVMKLIDNNRVAPDVIGDPEIAWWLASQLRADAFVLGELSLAGDEVKLTITPIGVKSGDAILQLSFVTPIHGDMKTQISTPIGAVHDVNSTQLLAAKGTLPKCVHCPNPQFSTAARDHHFQGTVILSVLIGLDGRARDIAVVKPVAYRLTEKAIEAVQSWTFVPGKSDDGKAIAVETPIEVTFRLY
jgi:TonB family protein